MADLHEALKNLSPIEWSDVPQDDLEPYLSDAFTAGELIINTVPPLQHGTPFHNARPHMHMPNLAKSHKDIHPSAARSQPPHPDHEALQKVWGKPMKFSEKDNPLHVALYKTAGHDRHGSWFARRSVHEGIGFDKMKRAMMREFPTSMAVTGGPGAGAVRGLAADRRLEQFEVPGQGQLEVYHLSAQFPGPVTARDFVTLLMTGDDVLTEKSATELDGGQKHVPRHFMIVSRPVEHPEAPEGHGYVRAQYESVELIREIPLSVAKKPADSSKSTPNLLSQTSERPAPPKRVSTATDVKRTSPKDHDTKSEKADQSEDDAEAEHELNPVEWIMVTRSDPGGGIPRFLVDRGTPETMIADIHKFFNWACSQDHIPGPDEDIEPQQVAATKSHSEKTTDRDGNVSGPKSSTTDHASSTTEQQNNGIGSIFTQALEAGVDAYAPASLAALVHDRLHPFHVHEETSDDSSDISSIDSFLSASEMQSDTSVADIAPLSTDNLSIASGTSDASTPDGKKKKPTQHEKELQKLIHKREKLDRELAKKRSSEEAKIRHAQEKSESEASKQQEKMDKEVRAAEDKHRKEMAKIEKKKAKEMQKAEEKRAKKDEQNKLSLVARERDEFRSQVSLYRRENALLREQLADLQALNGALTTKLGKVAGNDALRSVQDEVGRARASSVKSVASRTSAESSAAAVGSKGLEQKVEK